MTASSQSSLSFDAGPKLDQWHTSQTLRCTAVALLYASLQGLEQQMLAELVRAERPELEESHTLCCCAALLHAYDVFV
jgi:hypothetical protein